MRLSYYLLFISGLLMMLLISCEEEYIPITSSDQQKIVVESYIEKSEEGIPPYVILTKSLPFYSEFGINILEQLFIHDAKVLISTDQQKIELTEICIDDVPVEVRESLAKRFGLNLDSTAVNFCVYIDVLNQLNISEGVEYELNIYTSMDSVKSKAFIPALNPIDSIWFDVVPGKPLDSFLQLFCKIQDRPVDRDYYRYFTAGEGEALIPNFSSVTDDYFFNGQAFKFTLQKAMQPGEDFNETSGYFRKGDSIEIKWCGIEKAQFEFWNTLEVSRTRQGPFSSYVRIDGNISNGLGIFGTQNCKYYKLVVPN
ncbi:MAG: DUF4249 family protein [Saprospiraceae bacterium]|nr:DUF4249 family protein [Candidatus Vicinibacter affinis]